MRRLTSVLAGAALAASSLAVLAGSTPAVATECGASGGTIPGTPAQVQKIDLSPAGIFYIDDRDLLDADGDGVTQGLWTYMESNDTPDLQNGGEEVVLSLVPVQVPHIDPIPVDGPEPIGNVTTLFPNGAGGGSVAHLIGEADSCNDPSGSHDSIIT